MSTKLFSISLAILAWVAVTDISAQRPAASLQPQAEYNRLTLEFGGYLANISSNFRLGAERQGIGLDINFEQALGLETTALTYYGRALYRFSKNRRSAINARYFEVTRKARKVLQTDIEINDKVFTLGTELGSSFSLRVINVDYSYAFLQDDRVRISASFGFFIMPIRFTFSRDDNKEAANDIVAPLPALGIDSYFLLSRKFALRQGFHIFYLKIGETKGTMSDISISLEYMPIRNLAFGAGFNAFNIDITQQEANKPIIGGLIGNVGYKQSGVVLYAQYSFW